MKTQIQMSDQMIDELFKDGGGGKLVDALVEVDGKHWHTYSRDYLTRLYKMLPPETQMLAASWGLDDTVFGDNVVDWLRANGVPSQ